MKTTATTPKRQYIFTPPFNGSVHNTVTNGIVDYTGEEVRNEYINDRGHNVIEISFKNGLTPEQYINEKGLKNAVIANPEQMELIYNEYKSNLVTPFTETTERQFNYSLECLPPCRFTKISKNGCFFYISEAYTDNLHSFYAEYNGKFYTALKPKNIPTSEILKELTEVATS